MKLLAVVCVLCLLLAVYTEARPSAVGQNGLRRINRSLSRRYHQLPGMRPASPKAVQAAAAVKAADGPPLTRKKRVSGMAACCWENNCTLAYVYRRCVEEAKNRR